MRLKHIYVTITLLCAAVLATGCGSGGKTVIPAKEIPTIPGGPQAAGGDAGGKNNKQQNVPPGSGTAQ
jgi:hypothetical protein